MASKNMKKLRRRINQALEAGATVDMETVFEIQPINALRQFKPEGWKEDLSIKRGLFCLPHGKKLVKT